MSREIRVAVDIGGTFTDVVLETPDARFTAKVLTTPEAPEEGFMAGMGEVLANALVTPAQVHCVIHGTTLATNALIERKGARVALLTTKGFRDSLEIAYEHRFDQYDIYMERPAALVPRYLRFDISERIAADGSVLLALDEAGVRETARELTEQGVESVAVGYLHSYCNASHEQRTKDILKQHLPSKTAISLSSEISPAIREYDRFSTTVANAYVQPLISSYLARLETLLRDEGFSCPVLIMLSGGDMATVDVARRFPIRLVESGPAGGVILAQTVAAQCGLPRVVSFDMGGTTAKICILDDYSPQLSHNFEVARHYRYLKGSGFPLRVPVVDLVEIGAGGGSIATVDELNRIAVGPESAGSTPGPACYGRGGLSPTVTDADLALGKILEHRFAGGKIELDPLRAERSLAATVGSPLGLHTPAAAAGVIEMVDESMANAARVHAVESGKELAGRSLIAFGGAAPLHAARVASKLGIKEIIVPSGAGVGSAIGFLRAKVGFEVLRSRYHDLQRFEPLVVNELFDDMRREAEGIVRLGAPRAKLSETRTAYVRYRGQGHEVAVLVPSRKLEAADKHLLRARFEDEYQRLYGRIIPHLEIEAISWSLALSAASVLPAEVRNSRKRRRSEPTKLTRVYDPECSEFIQVPCYERAQLSAGSWLSGPALIVEDETTTFVTAGFWAVVNELGYLVLRQESSS